LQRAAIAVDVPSIVATERPAVPRAGHDAVADFALGYRSALMRAEAIETSHLGADTEYSQLVAIDLDGAPTVALEVGQ
jgi:hypothetical protein